MDVYQDIEQEILVRGDLYIPVLSQQKFNEISTNVAAELIRLAKEFVTLLDEASRDSLVVSEFKSNFDGYSKSLADLDNFRTEIESCKKMWLQGRGGLLEHLAPNSREDYTENQEFYVRVESLCEKWGTVSRKGWVAARTMIKQD